MVAVLHALSVGRQQEKAAEVFAAIQVGSRNGRFGDMTGDEVVQRFTEALALTGSAEKALDCLRARQAGMPAGPGTVKQDDEFVIIGGVKVPKTQA